MIKYSKYLYPCCMWFLINAAWSVETEDFSAIQRAFQSEYTVNLICEFSAIQTPHLPGNLKQVTSNGSMVFLDENVNWSLDENGFLRLFQYNSKNLLIGESVFDRQKLTEICEKFLSNKAAGEMLRQAGLNSPSDLNLEDVSVSRSSLDYSRKIHGTTVMGQHLGISFAVEKGSGKSVVWAIVSNLRPLPIPLQKADDLAPDWLGKFSQVVKSGELLNSASMELLWKNSSPGNVVKQKPKKLIDDSRSGLWYIEIGNGENRRLVLSVRCWASFDGQPAAPIMLDPVTFEVYVYGINNLK